MALDNELRLLINRLAAEVIKTYKIKIPIDNIDTEVQKIGGTIIEDVSISLNEFLDGEIRKRGNDSFEIAVSPFQTNERRNFTIAHEIGHLFLHMGYQTDMEHWEHESGTYYRIGNSEQEYQANEFAAAFLMPAKQYKETIDKYTENNYVKISEVARHFNVSVSAAENRGKWLGYLEW